MMNNAILFITLLSYSVIVSQSFMYLLSLHNAQLGLSGSSYTELRQLIDANMRARFKYAVYTALIANPLLVIVSLQSALGWQFITALIAFMALIVDVLLTLKGNMPLNRIMNSWAPENYPANWQEIRIQWLTIFRYRQVATIIGFVSLLIGLVFGNK